MGSYTRTGLVLALGVAAAVAGACETCRPGVKAAVYNGGFVPTLGALLLPLGLVAAVGYGFHRRNA